MESWGRFGELDEPYSPEGGSWGRFGEPEESYSPEVDSLKLPRRKGSFGEIHGKNSSRDMNGSRFSSTLVISPQVDSLKIPRRRGSFDGNKSFKFEESVEGDKTTSSSRCSSPTMVLNSSNPHHGKHTRMHRRSFNRPSFEIPSIEGSNSSSNSFSSNSNLKDDDDYLCQNAAQQHFQQHQYPYPLQKPALELEDAPTSPVRRASTGARFLAASFFGAQPLLAGAQDEDPEKPRAGAQDEDPEKPRRYTNSEPRPFMKSTLHGQDAPLQRRSQGLTRPCMENSMSSDGPILRPYRQLSSEEFCIDMACIGEETDEDLRSNRSNRTSKVDFSNRSNHTCLREFSTRNRTTVAPLSAEPQVVSEESEQCPVKRNINSIEHNSALSRSKTWPTNLKILLSIKRLSLRNIMKGIFRRRQRKGKSNRFYRKSNRFRRTIDKASEVLEQDPENSRRLSFINNF